MSNDLQKRVEEYQRSRAQKERADSSASESPEEARIRELEEQLAKEKLLKYKRVKLIGFLSVAIVLFAVVYSFYSQEEKSSNDVVAPVSADRDGLIEVNQQEKELKTQTERKVTCPDIAGFKLGCDLHESAITDLREKDGERGKKYQTYYYDHPDFFDELAIITNDYKVSTLLFHKMYTYNVYSDDPDRNTIKAIVADDLITFTRSLHNKWGGFDVSGSDISLGSLKYGDPRFDDVAFRMLLKEERVSIPKKGTGIGHIYIKVDESKGDFDSGVFMLVVRYLSDDQAQEILDQASEAKEKKYKTFKDF